VVARVLVVMAGLIGSVACGSVSNPTGASDPTLPPPSAPTALPPAPLTPAAVSGTWTLLTIDGGSLPYVMSRFGDTKIELLSDTLTFTANGTATESAQSRFTAGARVETDTTTAAGSFTIDGSTIRFTSDGRSRTATLNGTMLVANVDGMTWVFRRS
jgi:hypothetical protein